MADPDASWEFEETPEEPPAEATAAKPAGAEEKAPAKADASTEEEFPPPPQELSEAEQRKKHLYRHWIRPRFLQYNYIYNYRKNYYDDVIDYLDKRNKGYFIDTPRAQTWAERALRTYTHEIDRLRPIFIPSYHVNIHRADESALRKTYVNTFHAEHSHNFYHRKYKSVLY